VQTRSLLASEHGSENVACTLQRVAADVPVDIPADFLGVPVPCRDDVPRDAGVRHDRTATVSAAVQCDAGQAAARKADAETARMIKVAEGGPLEAPAELIALVQSLPDVPGPGSEAKDFAKLCRLLGVTATIEPTWRLLSAFSHPTTAAAYFLTQAKPEQVIVRKSPILPFAEAMSAEVMALTVQCLLWSGFAMDRLIAGHPLHAALKMIADEAQVAESPVRAGTPPAES
jgi:hypothetical protein